MIDNFFAMGSMAPMPHYYVADQPSQPPEQPGDSINEADAPLAVEPDTAEAGPTSAQNDQAVHRLPSRLRSLADLEPRPISWLSPSRIGRGLLHIIEGETNSGLDEFVASVAAALSKGRALPGGNSEPVQTVLLMALDHRLKTYYKPLLKAADAAFDRILAEPDFTFPDDFERLEQAIRDKNVDVILIHNVFAFLGQGINPNFDTDSWRIIRAFSGILDRTGVTVILTRGIGKHTTTTTPALHKGLGATAWTDGADVVLAVSQTDDLVTIETVVLRHGCERAPLQAEITRPSAGSYRTLVYRPEPDLERDPERDQEPQVPAQQKQTSRKPRRSANPSPAASS